MTYAARRLLIGSFIPPELLSSGEEGGQQIGVGSNRGLGLGHTHTNVKTGYFPGGP